MDCTSETKLNKPSAFSYKSFGSSSELADVSSPNYFTCDLTEKHELNPSKELVAESPDLSDRCLSDLKETDKDSSSRETPLCAVSIIVAVAVTIALILQIYLGQSPAFIKGVLVSDHELCTALGQRVLLDSGSSVDAAIAGALCLGVVHPHVSGVGGGGVVLIHDIHKNKTRVINFQGTTPKTLREEMLHDVTALKAGLQVGVPGMLRGLRHAHSLYGSLSWEDIVRRAADVAREGFNVSRSLSDAIAKVKGDQLSQRFRDMFFPDGRPLSPGSHVRMAAMAGVLEAGLLNFYHGNLSHEIEDEVRANGGVLSREDISNYSVEVQEPLEGQYNDFIIKVPPPPSAGAAVISALNLLEAVHLSENNITENQTYSWIAEALKTALTRVSDLDDPKHNSSVLLSDMLSKSQAEVLRQRMNHSSTSLSEYYSMTHSLQSELMAGQVVVMGPDNIMVSVASSLSRPFGSRIITRSGIILNSLIFDFSWPNRTRVQLQTNQKTIVESGKRALSFLMPVMMVPNGHECGTYMALSSSGGQNSLSAITQMLVSALFFHKEKNDTVVDSELPEERGTFLHAKGHKVQRVKPNTAVQGIQRDKDIIEAIKVAQLSDSLL